jgi:thiol-disulfide isomerase/thioredoxin
MKAWPAKKAMPALALQDLDGRLWNVKTLHGKVVVLNFWATWCEPCRAEMPSLELLAQKHSREDLLVLAVNYQESDAKVRRFMEAASITLPVLLDRDGAAARAWTGRIFPTTVILDRRGQARYTITGEYDWTSEDAVKLITLLLRSPSPARSH